MILSVEGEEATAKTTLAYTGPLPIVGFSFDMGSKRAIHGAKFEEFFEDLKVEFIKYKKGMGPESRKVWQGNDITIFEIPQPIQLDEVKMKGFSELWSFFIGTIFEALEDDYVRCVVVDTMTLARRHKADAHLQDLQARDAARKQLLQREYGPVNDSIRNIYTAAAGLDKNLVAVHHLMDERLNEELTGRRVLEGLAQTYRYVDIAIRMRWVNKTFSGVMSKNGYAPEMVDTPMVNPTWDSIVDLTELARNRRITFDRRLNAER